MEVVRREMPAIGMEIVEGRSERGLGRPHLDFAREAVSFAEIAGGAGRDHVLPGSLPAFGAGDHVIEGKILPGAAILAGETITEEDVEAGEGRVSRGFDVIFERNDGGKTHLEARTSDRLVVLGDNVDPIKEHRLDGVLPTPDRQGIIAQRPIIGVQHQSRTGFRPDDRLDVYRHSTSSSGKSRSRDTLTLYREIAPLVKFPSSFVSTHPQANRPKCGRNCRGSAPFRNGRFLGTLAARR